jgi:Flp pilus assembly secretin CpaC
MKPQLPLHPARSLALLGCLIVLCCGQGRAQTPVAQQLDVFFGETKLLPIDRPVDDFSVVPDNIVKVDKVEGSPNQLSIVGVAGGSATLTIKSDGRTLLYDIAVTPAPERLYINLHESKRLTFKDPIDDTNLSQQGIVRVIQPDTSNNVLLVEANVAGKTTLTVYSKGEIYRYFISTFENRGADVLEIQNAFSAKGYRNLTISFDKDQAIIGGTVPTQEELDDAVRIVKQFTQFVVIKAQLGQEIEQSEYTEQESIIINNIQRIANVKGLTIRVKFPQPTVVTTSTYTKSTGDYIEPTVTTTPQGGTVRGSGFQPPKDPNQQGGFTGPLEPKPQQNTTETVSTTENTSIPEKIFLYGDIEDDLQEAKIIRVARTFCPFIVSFLTVKDPIQLRTQIRFMQVNSTDTRNTGFDWSNGGAGPSITLGFGNTAFGYFGALTAVQSLTNFFTYGVTGTVDATATLHLFETTGVAKLLRETQIFLTNGQPGWYSEGEVQSYVSSSVTSASSPPVVTLTATAIFLGVNLDISPLNLVDAGGKDPTGQKIYGIPGTIGSGASSYTLEQNTDPSPDAVSKVARPIQQGGGAPLVDNTVKYVDENGLIGLNISTQLTIPNGTFQKVSFGVNGEFLSLPDFFVRTTRTRVNLRDGQTVVINGLIDEQTTRTITSIPFLDKIPLFSTLFKNPSDLKTHEEVLVLVTPRIVRMRDADSARYPKPVYTEMHDLAREYGDVPIIKPVRYDARAVDIRPESPKDMKDTKTDIKDTKSLGAPGEPPPFAPRASGGMQTLQPPSETTAPAPATPARPVDNPPSAPDTSRQPSNPQPLAPSSTLP